MGRRNVNEFPDVGLFEAEIALFRQNLTTVEQTETAETTVIVVSELFYFDPNIATDFEFGQLGLNQRQISNIRNYQAAGGRFRRKEDFQRLFTISANQFRELEPYMIIPTSPTLVRNIETSTQEPHINVSPEETKTQIEVSTQQPIELNLADSSLLTTLSGIGPVLAARTLRYRTLIGGFVDVAQLSEVYGVTIELTERLALQLTADSTLIRKIPVNTANFNALSRHPYINEQQARGILHYRQLQERINNVNELVKNNIIERHTAEKIRPYLSFE